MAKSGSTLTLFHGTCLCAANVILQQGLRARSYLTNNETIADYYAECAMEACEQQCDDYVLLRVTVDTTHLAADMNSYDEPLSYFRNAYATNDDDWFEGVESGEIPSPENEQDHETSLKVVKSVLCLCHVDSNCINS